MNRACDKGQDKPSLALLLTIKAPYVTFTLAQKPDRLINTPTPVNGLPSLRIFRCPVMDYASFCNNTQTTHYVQTIYQRKTVFHLLNGKILDVHSLIIIRLKNMTLKAFQMKKKKKKEL